MSSSECGFKCCEGSQRLTEEKINEYDAGQYDDLVELVEDHGMDVNEAQNHLQAKTLLLKHIRERDKAENLDSTDGSTAVKTDVVQQAVKEHHVRRTQLLQIAQEVQEFLRALPNKRRKELEWYFPSLDSDVTTAVEELGEKKFSFIVAGETGSGKSCFINLLMGHTKQNFLPVSNCPSTSCLCEISYGPKGQLRAYKAGSVKPDKVEDLDEHNMRDTLSNYTHQKDERDKDITYTRVEVDWPLEWLKDGLTIVDSPGFGENCDIAERVKETMPSAYGFIYVFDSTNGGGIQQGELEDLLTQQSTAKSSGSEERRLCDEFDPRTAIFLFNKWDQVDKTDKQKVRDNAKEKLLKVYSGIDPESQIFFISTLQATEALEENCITEDYSKVIRGVEKLMMSSMTSKMRKYYNFFVDVLSRLAFILKAYIVSFKDIKQKYDQVQQKLNNLSKLSGQVMADMTKMLKDETQDIVEKLRDHMCDDRTLERLCKWELGKCPTNAKDVKTLALKVAEKVHERVSDEIKQWLSDTKVFQNANMKMVIGFQEKFLSLKEDLGDIETDLLDVPDKELQRLFGNIHTSASTDDDIFSTKQKIVIGVTAPLWVPVAILAAPVVIGLVLRAKMKQKKQQKKYYGGYLTGASGPLPELMALETREEINSVILSNQPQEIIEEQMQELAKKLLVLMNKIPEYVKADQQLLCDMKQDYQEDLKKQTRQECKELSVKVFTLRNKLDYFLLQYIHENDIPPEDLEQGAFIAEGTFGQVYKYTMKTKEGDKEVAAKVMKEWLTEANATEVRVEHNNLRKVQSENTVKYFGLVLLPKESQSDQPSVTPVMVMELCDSTLNEIIYNPKKYVGPGNLSPQESARGKLMASMRNFAKQIANGLRHMHRHNLVHRDLKPANILVETRKDGDGQVQYILKLCDFGLAKKEEEITNTDCGTPLYKAPEVGEAENYNKQSDVYSYGLILIELFYGKVLYKLDCVNVKCVPIRFTRDPLAENSPPRKMKVFMESCRDKDPNERPKAETCYNHFNDSNLEENAEEKKN